MKLFEDHAFLLFMIAVVSLIGYAVIVIAGKPVDERIIGLGFVVAVSALAGRADANK